MTVVSFKGLASQNCSHVQMYIALICAYKILGTVKQLLYLYIPILNSSVLFHALDHERQIYFTQAYKIRSVGTFLEVFLQF